MTVSFMPQQEEDKSKTIIMQAILTALGNYSAQQREDAREKKADERFEKTYAENKAQQDRLNGLDDKERARLAEERAQKARDANELSVLIDNFGKPKDNTWTVPMSYPTGGNVDERTLAAKYAASGDTVSSRQFLGEFTSSRREADKQEQAGDVQEAKNKVTLERLKKHLPGFDARKLEGVDLRQVDLADLYDTDIKEAGIESRFVRTLSNQKGPATVDEFKRQQEIQEQYAKFAAIAGSLTATPEQKRAAERSMTAMAGRYPGLFGPDAVPPPAADVADSGDGGPSYYTRLNNEFFGTLGDSIVNGTRAVAGIPGAVAEAGENVAAAWDKDYAVGPNSPEFGKPSNSEKLVQFTDKHLGSELAAATSSADRIKIGQDTEDAHARVFADLRKRWHGFSDWQIEELITDELLLAAYRSIAGPSMRAN